jgi:hypothetical protein
MRRPQAITTASGQVFRRDWSRAVNARGDFPATAFGNSPHLEGTPGIPTGPASGPAGTPSPPPGAPGGPTRSPAARHQRGAPKTA